MINLGFRRGRKGREVYYTVSVGGGGGEVTSVVGSLSLFMCIMDIIPPYSYCCILFLSLIFILEIIVMMILILHYSIYLYIL